MEYTNELGYLLFLIIITTDFAMVDYQNKKHWNWLYQLGQKILNLLYTTARVAVRNDLTSQLDLKHILIMCTIILILMIMTLILWLRLNTRSWLLLGILNYMVDRVQKFMFLIWYRIHLKKRIKKNDFGRHEEW